MTEIHYGISPAKATGIENYVSPAATQNVPFRDTSRIYIGQMRGEYGTLPSKGWGPFSKPGGWHKFTKNQAMAHELVRAHQINVQGFQRSNPGLDNLARIRANDILPSRLNQPERGNYKWVK